MNFGPLDKQTFIKVECRCTRIEKEALKKYLLDEETNFALAGSPPLVGRFQQPIHHCTMLPYCVHPHDGICKEHWVVLDVCPAEIEKP